MAIKRPILRIHIVLFFGHIHCNKVVPLSAVFERILVYYAAQISTKADSYIYVFGICITCISCFRLDLFTVLSRFQHFQSAAKGATCKKISPKTAWKNIFRQIYQWA